MKLGIGLVTKYIISGVNIIFIGYPMRTALGLLFGLSAKVLAKILSPVLAQLKYINLVSLSVWDYIILGIFLFHIRTVIAQLMNKSILSENEEKAFDAIRIAKDKGQLTEWQIQNMYLDLCKKILENVDLKDKTKQEIQDQLES